MNVNTAPVNGSLSVTIEQEMSGATRCSSEDVLASLFEGRVKPKTRFSVKSTQAEWSLTSNQPETHYFRTWRSVGARLQFVKWTETQ